MTQCSPTSVPVLASVRNGRYELGITSIDLHPDVWGVRGRLIGRLVGAVDFRLEAFDAAGAPFKAMESGEGGDDGARDFDWYFASAPPADETIRLIGTVDELRIEMSVAFAEPVRAGRASILRVESSGSSRWPRAGGSVWRSPSHRVVLKQVFDHRSARALPDEVVPLGASLAEVAGHELVFLCAERWGDVWWLRHHWENPAAMHSLLGGDIELVHEAGTIVGVQIGGGTSPHGVANTHAFASSRLPDQFTLRLPAPDNGPPLFEADVQAR